MMRQEPEPSPDPHARTRLLPVPAGAHRSLDPVSKCLRSGLAPPYLTGLNVHAFGVLDLVPALAQPHNVDFAMASTAAWSLSRSAFSVATDQFLALVRPRTDVANTPPANESGRG